jgi:hypothetical protein
MLTRRFTASVARTTLTAAALGLGALGFAGTAGASSVDEAFLAQLQADGITPPSAARAISDAHASAKPSTTATRARRSSTRSSSPPV